MVVKDYPPAPFCRDSSSSQRGDRSGLCPGTSQKRSRKAVRGHWLLLKAAPLYPFRSLLAKAGKTNRLRESLRFTIKGFKLQDTMEKHFILKSTTISRSPIYPCTAVEFRCANLPDSWSPAVSIGWVPRTLMVKPAFKCRNRL